MRIAPLLMILALFVCGCGGRMGKTTDTPGATAQDSSTFAGRLEAAKAIFDSTKRDPALAALALDAAKAGDGEVAKEAIKNIFSSTAKDDAGYNAAVALARAGKTKEAKAIADLMFSTSRKDAALAKIAEGG